MVKQKLVEWAMSALIDYVEQHGADLAAELSAWLLDLLKKAEDQLLAAPSPPSGLEQECQQLLEEFAAMNMEDES